MKQILQNILQKFFGCANFNFQKTQQSNLQNRKTEIFQTVQI